PQARTMLANSLRGVLAQLLLKKADGSGRVAVNEILIGNAAVSAIIREGATQKLQDVIVSGRGQGMHFMADAIDALLQHGTATPAPTTAPQPPGETQRRLAARRSSAYPSAQAASEGVLQP